MKTLRHRLAGLVVNTDTPLEDTADENADADDLTVEKWAQLLSSDDMTTELDICRRIYRQGGVDSFALRQTLWPMLLRQHAFGSSPEERDETDANARNEYEAVVSQWLSLEVVVRQRDREQMAVSLARAATFEQKATIGDLDNSDLAAEPIAEVDSDAPKTIAPSTLQASAAQLTMSPIQTPSSPPAALISLRTRGRLKKSLSLEEDEDVLRVASDRLLASSRSIDMPNVEARVRRSSGGMSPRSSVGVLPTVSISYYTVQEGRGVASRVPGAGAP